MKIYEKYNDDTSTTHRLFSFVPIYQSIIKGDTTIYKYFGIPVWKVCRAVDESKSLLIKKHYFLCIPFARIDEEYELSGKVTKFPDVHMRF